MPQCLARSVHTGLTAVHSSGGEADHFPGGAVHLGEDAGHHQAERGQVLQPEEEGVRVGQDPGPEGQHQAAAGVGSACGDVRGAVGRGLPSAAALPAVRFPGNGTCP